MVSKLERITQEEYEETFESSIEGLQNACVNLINQYQKYLRDKQSGKYVMSYFKRDDTLFYARTPKKLGFEVQDDKEKNE